jgi:nucleoside-diphosphate-sugar epimerase/peptidoglycan/xylan/chitin deacetylase (PgdA/CDA1 family)
MLTPAMSLFITGAAGFIGSAVVTQALAKGHRVVALVRRSSDLSSVEWIDDPAVTIVRGDLRQRGEWVDSLNDTDAVIHCAYGQGDFFSQFAGTVVGTENLLGAMEQHDVRRLVHLSTFSVYDYRAMRAGASLDETAPIEAHPELRDDYTRTKLVQDQLVREFEQRGGAVTLVRPGAVYGPGMLWDAGLTMRVFGDRWLAVAPNAKLKLTYVQNVAEAILLSAERPEAIGETFNIVDTDAPTQRTYAKALRRHGVAVPKVIPVPYRVMRAVADLVDGVNRSFFGHKARVPWVLSPSKLDARCKPFTYPNERARWKLGWTPRASLDDALDAISTGTPIAPMHARLGRQRAATPPAARRVVKLAASLGVRAVDITAAAVGRGLPARSRGVVLMYHDIVPSERETFRRQLDVIGKVGTPSGLDDLNGEPDGTWRVGVTFDDAWRSFSEDAMEELQRRAIPAALFVPSALLADDNGNESARELMTVGDLRSVASELDTIGSHGRTHARLGRLDDAALKSELAGSRDELEQIVGRPVDAHAFPYGDWTPRVVAAARDAGYVRLYGIVPDIVRSHGQEVLPRVEVGPQDWPIEFRLKALGAYRWMAMWMRAKDRRHSGATGESS